MGLSELRVGILLRVWSTSVTEHTPWNASGVTEHNPLSYGRCWNCMLNTAFLGVQGVNEVANQCFLVAFKPISINFLAFIVLVSQWSVLVIIQLEKLITAKMGTKERLIPP